MDRERHTAQGHEVEYYVLADETVGRVRYDPETKDDVDGEILEETGEWQECSVWESLADGDEITPEEADDRILELGGEV